MLIALVAAYPIVYAIWLSLHEYSVRAAGLSRWAEPSGLGNYIDALSRAPSSGTASQTTFVFTVFSVLSSSRSSGSRWRWRCTAAFKGQGLLRTVVLVPWAVLTVVTAIMWRTIFEPSSAS